LLLRAGSDLLFDFPSHGFEIDPHFLEDVDGYALSETDEAEEQMFGADEVVVEADSFLARKGEYLLSARGKAVGNARFVPTVFRGCIHGFQKRPEPVRGD